MGIFSKLNETLSRVFRFQMGSNSELAGKIRAVQSKSVLDSTLPIMLMNLLSAGIIVILLKSKPGAEYLFSWGLVMVGFSAISIYSHYKNNDNYNKTTTSKKHVINIIAGSLILGALWGILPLMMYTGADLQTKMVLISCCAGIMGGGAIAFYRMPLAMFGLLMTLMTGLSISLVISATSLDFITLIILSVFIFSLISIGLKNAVEFEENLKTTFKVKDQSETLNMLLTDFSDAAYDWLWEADKDGNITLGMTQFKEHAGIDLTCFDPQYLLKDSGHTKTGSGMKAFEELWAYYINGLSFKNLNIPIQHNDSTKWVSLSGKPVLDENECVKGYHGLASDITEVKIAEERIAFLAFNDALTGLVNRETFATTLEQEFDKEEPGNWAVLYLDLDGFKRINDYYGHHIGDQVLVEVGQRVKKIIHEQDVIARLGGDEFAILSRKACGVQSLSALGENIVEAISENFDIDGCNFEVTTSIGIALAGRDGQTPQQLLNNADLALYRAKAEGKSTFRFFEIEMDEIVKQRRAMEADLRLAIRNKALSINFQPLIDADSERTSGFESLVRWQCERQGNVPPSDFIPLAERMGLVSEIGDWVLMQACKEALNWPDHLSIAVNLSPQQFQGGHIVDTVKHVLDITGLKPSRLELEITEGLFIENTEETLLYLNDLKALGVSLALDDFGTGYSSLSYLLKFPFDKLKIDRSFISSVEEDSAAKNVLEAIVKLGDILNLNVTAEGVETLAQVDMLKSMQSCTHFQGFHYSEPLTAEELPNFLLAELNNAISKGEEQKPMAVKAAE